MIGKLVFFALAFGVPLVFQMSRVVEEAEFPVPDVTDRQIATPRAIHPLETTVDFARGNRMVG
ncbi:MAG: hypothetical protein ABI268_13605 [Rhodanobacter sp.]